MVNTVGIDVGGTHTDAVLLQNGRIVKTAKVLTTDDIASGLSAAMEAVRCEGRVDRVHIGTTAFTNALVERKGLERAGAIRIGAPASASLPPMIDWPDDLRRAVHNPFFFAAGGREYDGRAIRPLDRGEIEGIAESLASTGVRQAAVTAVFGTAYPDDELRCAEWLHASLPELGVSLSHLIGRFGILERENATLLNAMLRPLAERTVVAYGSAFSRTGTSIFISQNDGTVMASGRATELPVLTLASGPTNSLRGAAQLTGLCDAIVLDVGGTTTDAGLLRNGYPQLSGLSLDIGGVRTNFRMPDLCSVGIGGGSVVNATTGAVGPESVGNRLSEEALSFGGATLTLTDVAVAAERMQIGERRHLAGVSRALIERVDAHLTQRMARLLENFDRAGHKRTVVLVGGGAALVEDALRSLGRDVIRPDHDSVANAYGAATAQAGGEADITLALSTMTRAQALRHAESLAHRRAEDAGARPDSIVTIELEGDAINYLPSGSIRVRAKAVGDLEVD